MISSTHIQNTKSNLIDTLRKFEEEGIGAQNFSKTNKIMSTQDNSE
jgi:hypothetical protein